MSGHASPVMCSLDASPLPNATQKRPGNITPRVAIFWATTAGWYRCPGAHTQPMVRDVVASAAPSHAQAYPLWPCDVVHGEKWSEHIAIAKPASSAFWTSASSCRGSICSCEAWKPNRVMASANP